MAAASTPTGEATQAHNCWDGCIQGTANRFKCNDMTSEKVAQVAGIVLAILSALIFVSALMVQYPMAAKTFFTLFGFAAVASLITLVVATVKYCKEHEIQSDDVAAFVSGTPAAVVDALKGAGSGEASTQ